MVQISTAAAGTIANLYQSLYRAGDAQAASRSINSGASQRAIKAESVPDFELSSTADTATKQKAEIAFRDALAASVLAKRDKDDSLDRLLDAYENAAADEATEDDLALLREYNVYYDELRPLESDTLEDAAIAYLKKEEPVLYETARSEIEKIAESDLEELYIPTEADDAARVYTYPAALDLLTDTAKADPGTLVASLVIAQETARTVIPVETSIDSSVANATANVTSSSTNPTDLVDSTVAEAARDTQRAYQTEEAPVEAAPAEEETTSDETDDTETTSDVVESDDTETTTTLVTDSSSYSSASLAYSATSGVATSVATSAASATATVSVTI